MTLKRNFKKQLCWPSPKGSSKRGLKGSVMQRQLLKLNAINVGGKKPKLRPTKDFEAKYNKFKAKLALFSSGALTSKSTKVKNKGLVAKAYEWHEEDVSSYDNKTVEVKVLMALADDENDTKASIPGVERPWLTVAEGFNFPNQDTGRILPAESQLKVTISSVIVSDYSIIDYDSADESSVCSTPLPLLEKLACFKSVSGPKTIKSVFKSNSTFKAKT
nr:hypothetical protein [Tanacetum cinerariifolium]